MKEALIFDINDDGLNEVVLALTDRVVRSYQWQQGAAEGQQGQLVPMNKWEFGLQVTDNRVEGLSQMTSVKLSGYLTPSVGKKSTQPPFLWPEIGQPHPLKTDIL